jgi:glycosyltransferase involved in cell wall biosynthesis
MRWVIRRSNMKILIITQYFPPEMGAPQARLSELGKRLENMGHKVTVLTALPNYPTGRIFTGYKNKLRMTEMMNNIRVIRTFMYPSNSSHILPRFFSYISFGLAALLLGPWGIDKQDVVLIESPPLFLVPFALLITKFVGGKAVLMVSDIWPDIIIRMGHASKNGLLTKVMLWLEKFSYEQCSAVALTNPGARKQIVERFPHLKNVTVVSNGVDTDIFSPQFREDVTRKKLGAEPGDFLVGYCGLHGLAQGLDVIIDAAAKLKNYPRIKLIMLGDGPTKQRLMEKVSNMRLSNIKFIEHCPKNEMPSILASLDVSLVPLSVRLPGTMPSKMYEAMASGTPPIVAKGCEAESLITKYNVGCCYEPGNSDEMAEAILYLTANPAQLEIIRSNCIELSKRFDRNLIAARTERVLVAVSKKAVLPEVNW